MKKTIATLLCLCVVFLTACFGPFKLTKRVYDWNASLDNKWGREALFLVMSVVPVYGFVILADSIVFNSIDFWGAQNGSSAQVSKTTKFVSVDNKQAVLSYSAADKKMRIDMFENYRPTAHLLIESPHDGLTIARDSAGNVVMTAKRLKDGAVMIEDKDGKMVALHHTNN